MVHLILGINFGFWVLQLLFLQNSCYVILFLNNNKFQYLYWRIHEYIYNIYWYNRAIVLFDYTNFKASLIIEIINFKVIKNGPFSYACHLPCECD